MKNKWWLIGLGIALVSAILSPLASPSPDGLERVAEDKGIMGMAQGALYEIMPDYSFPGITNEPVATIIAGVIGTLTLFGLAYGLAWLIRNRKGPVETDSD